MKITLKAQSHDFPVDVQAQTGVEVAKCYQCGKCAAGCPVGVELDLTPTQVMRLVQLGQREQVLASRAIWLCASCQTCTTRCPQGVEIARLMEGLRIMARQAG